MQRTFLIFSIDVWISQLQHLKYGPYCPTLFACLDLCIYVIDISHILNHIGNCSKLPINKSLVCVRLNHWRIAQLEPLDAHLLAPDEAIGGVQEVIHPIPAQLGIQIGTFGRSPGRFLQASVVLDVFEGWLE